LTDSLEEVSNIVIYLEALKEAFMPAIRVLISETYDPWFNLATEDYIFQEMEPDHHILFLWRNDNTGVIGRY